MQGAGFRVQPLGVAVVLTSGTTTVTSLDTPPLPRPLLTRFGASGGWPPPKCCGGGAAALADGGIGTLTASLCCRRVAR